MHIIDEKIEKLMQDSRHQSLKVLVENFLSSE